MRARPSVSWQAHSEDSDAGATNLSTVELTESRELALAAASAAVNKKATDIRILELAALLGVTDFFVMASVANERQLGTVTEEVEYRLEEQTGRSPERREGTKETGWVILDYGEIVVHGFTEQQRAYYDVERLWSDAPTVEFDEATPVE